MRVPLFSSTPLPSPPTSSSHLPLRLLTHNIRYATDSPFRGEEYWSVRASRIISQLNFHTQYCPEAFICLQEALVGQVRDVERGLNGHGHGHGHGEAGPLSDADESVKDEEMRSRSKTQASGANASEHMCRPETDQKRAPSHEWTYIGVGRDDGHRAGEYAPIFYRPRVWALNAFKTVWLSETPDRPSRGWDAASVRVLTVGVFTRRGTAREVVVMSTHLDDQGVVARREGARMIVEEVRRLRCGKGGRAVVLAGDFNSETEGEAYRVVVESGFLRDVRDLVPEGERYGHRDTFTGFGYEGLRTTRLDFVFVGGGDTDEGGNEKGEVIGGDLKVEGYGVLENRFDDGVYCSDHRAVVADLRLL